MNPVEQFFYDHAGYSHDSTKETEEQGRQRGALLLASAERWARETGYAFQWDIDHDASSADWLDKNEDGGEYHDPWRVWSCWMRDTQGNVTQALHAIDFGRDGEPWRDPYRRVVEAKLALAEWHDVVKS